MKIQEMEQYEPVHIWHLLAPMMMWWLWIEGIFWIKQNSENSAVGILFVIVTFVGCFIFVRHPLGEYWRRNVRGYVAAFWLEEEKLLAKVFLRGDPALYGYGEFQGSVIALPLGGWFAETKLLYLLSYQSRPYELIGQSRLAYWRVELVGWVAGGSHTLTTVRLVDRNGDGVTLFVQGALAVFNEYVVKDMLCRPPNSWSGIMNHLVASEHLLREELVSRTVQRDSLLAVIKLAISCLQESKRFVHSKEGERLRHLLTEKLMRSGWVDNPQLKDVKVPQEQSAS